MGNNLSVKNSSGVIVIDIPDNFVGVVKIAQKGVVVLESKLPAQREPVAEPAKPKA